MFFKQPLVRICCLLLAASCFSIMRKASAQSAFINEDKSWSWVSEPWTGNDQPFLKLKRQIDLASKTQKPANLLPRYKAVARLKPNDVQAQYAWAYCALKATWAKPDNEANLLGGVRLALSQAKSPHSYEFDRVRFMEAAPYPSDKRLRIMGDRLIKHNPKDWFLKQLQARVLLYVTGLEGADGPRAIQLMQDVVKAQPRKANVYATLGGVYSQHSYVTRDPKEMQKAIDAYRKYLSLTSKNDAWRSQAKLIIQNLERRRRAAS